MSNEFESSDGEDILTTAMEHVIPRSHSPSEEQRVRNLLHNLKSTTAPSRGVPSRTSNVAHRHAAVSRPAHVPRLAGEEACVAATLHLTPMQVGRLIELCTANDLPMPQITQLSQGMPSVTVRPATGHTLTVTAGDVPSSPPLIRNTNSNALLHMQPMVAPRGGNSFVGDEPVTIVCQPGDEHFQKPPCFDPFVTVNPEGHESIRNPGKDVPLARMVLLKIPHGWGPAHMMSMLHKLGITCYFARKHIKMGPRGEVSKGSGKVLVHEQEESKLMEMSGAVWCVPGGFYRVNDQAAAATYLETHKHQWGKHLPYELLKVEREEREQCEKSRVAMSVNFGMGNPVHSGSGMFGNNCYFDGFQPFTRTSTSSVDDMGLSPSQNSSASHFSYAQRSMRGAQNFKQALPMMPSSHSFDSLQ